MSTTCRFYGSGPYIKFPIDSDSRFRRNDIASSDIFLVNRNGIPNSAGIPTGIPNLLVDDERMTDCDELGIRHYYSWFFKKLSSKDETFYFWKELGKHTKNARSTCNFISRIQVEMVHTVVKFLVMRGWEKRNSIKRPYWFL